jgi:RNA polymerase sigma-70 factor, ECF subfamily
LPAENSVVEPQLKTADSGDAERLEVEAAQRDPARFADLYERNFNRIYAFIARRVRDRDEAQDLTADVFHDALRNLKRFEWRGIPFSAWLLRIASNAIADRFKRSARDREVRNLQDRAAVQVDEVEHHARLFGLVDGLPADQRRVITMRFAGQKSIREIARSLGRSEGAIKQLQFRGLKNLKSRMGETDG